VGLALVCAAYHCTLPTGLAVAAAIGAAAQRNLPWPTKVALLLVAGLGVVSERGMTAALHSCWGDAPHAFWW
jgi:hypothetical protein